VPHFPQGACSCGADLADAAGLGVAASHQEVEIPEMASEVIQHDLHAVACSCERVHRAAAPAGAGAPGTVTYGIGLQAWCVYLMAAHVVPVHRCAELIEALTGARPSPGLVHGLLARAAAAVEHANQLIRALIITASVVCADETPIRVGPGPNVAFNRRCNRAGVRRIKVHDTRRTCGSLLAALDVHPRVAMTILRHSKIALTMEIYTQVPDKVIRDALRRLSDQLDQAAGRMPDEAAG
jgi:Transposase IS66 family